MGSHTAKGVRLVGALGHDSLLFLETGVSKGAISNSEVEACQRDRQTALIASSRSLRIRPRFNVLASTAKLTRADRGVERAFNAGASLHSPPRHLAKSARRGIWVRARLTFCRHELNIRMETGDASGRRPVHDLEPPPRIGLGFGLGFALGFALGFGLGAQRAISHDRSVPRPQLDTRMGGSEPSPVRPDSGRGNALGTPPNCARVTLSLRLANSLVMRFCELRVAQTR